MSDDRNDFAFDLRQYRLMQERIRLLQDGERTLPATINDLESLLGSLKQAAPDWRDAFLQELGQLEILYATNLHRNASKLRLTEDEAEEVAALVKNLSVLAESAHQRAEAKPSE